MDSENCPFYLYTNVKNILDETTSQRIGQIYLINHTKITV